MHDWNKQRVRDLFPSGDAGLPWRGSLPWEYVATSGVLLTALGDKFDRDSAGWGPAILKLDAHDEHAKKPCAGGLVEVLGRANTVQLELDRLVVDAVHREGFDVRYGSLLEMPFAAEAFNLVADYSTIDHVGPDKVSTAILEYRRVLKSGGVLLLFVWESTDPADLGKAARDAIQPYGVNHQFYFATGLVQEKLRFSDFEILSHSWFAWRAVDVTTPGRQMTRFICVKV